MLSPLNLNLGSVTQQRQLNDELAIANLEGIFQGLARQVRLKFVVKGLFLDTAVLILVLLLLLLLLLRLVVMLVLMGRRQRLCAPDAEIIANPLLVKVASGEAWANRGLDGLAQPRAALCPLSAGAQTA